ncbi:MAG: septation protein SpoVG family protein [Pirellulaceae bacterium]|nr:septation protein SpoVG family protein [Pirellulaceae bacterium]
MNVSEVRVSLINGPDEQLLAFCTVTFDRAFVVRDIRIIQGASGPFVAMPSRRVTANCSACGSKNNLGSKFCAECGTKLPPMSQSKLPERSRGFIDIAHPINAKSRERIQAAILEAYDLELLKSRQPDYQPDSLDSDLGEKNIRSNSPQTSSRPASSIQDNAPQTNSPHWRSDRTPKREQTDT